jgi:hypothetical protein
MSKFLQATNLTWSDSTATSVFQNCPVIHCDMCKTWWNTTNWFWNIYLKNLHLYFWSNNSALFEHWNWKSSFKHRGWYVFARRKGVKIAFFSTYSLNYVKYVLTIWWNRHRRFQFKENMTVNALIFLTTGAFNIVLHSTSLYA